MFQYLRRTSTSPSSDALKSGKAFSVATHAAIRKVTIVIFTPSRASAFSSLRHASSSVMSASSLWVTWGIITQLRARFRAELFWIRGGRIRSTGPNSSKATRGYDSKSRPAEVTPAPAVGAEVAAVVDGESPL